MDQVLHDLRAAPIVEWAYRPTQHLRVPRTPDPFLGEQWYLSNIGQSGGCSGNDLNLAGVAEKGSGAVIAIVDDGLELGHPDLIDRTRNMAAYHYDYQANEVDTSDGEHGTAVAGIAAATADNGIGIAGVAPLADLLGVRLLGGWITDLDEANALGHQQQIVDISNNSWGVPEDSAYLDRPSELAVAAMDAGVASGRGGLGILYVWSAGNGGADGNSNLDGYANSPYAIAVAATNECGRATYYSEPGTNILVNAPSSDWNVDVFSTDRTGAAGYNDGLGWYGEPDDPDYTGTFGGTSASTPMVSGVVARMLQANPRLSWRDIRRILATSAFRNDPNHVAWRPNAAGYWYNPYYGFGRVDAAAAVAVARGWQTGIATLQVSYPVAMDPVTIPEPGVDILRSSVNVPVHYLLEDVALTLSSDHRDWSDLTVALVSPSGTRSVLSTGRPDGLLINESYAWRFSSQEFYGESAYGTWVLEVHDEQVGRSGRLLGWELSLNGVVMASGRGDIAPLGAVDGRVNVADALLALRIALHLELVTDPLVIANGDLAPEAGPDGVITIADALAILRIALGLAQ